MPLSRGRLTISGNKQTAQVVVVEAAILLEAGWRSLVEQLWVVAASVDVVITRLKTYKNISEEQARARIAAQLSNAERIAQADKVIWNDHGLANCGRL